MTPRLIYYINYLDPKTGFLKREEFETHREMELRKQKLLKLGITRLTKGHFERE